MDKIHFLAIAAAILAISVRPLAAEEDFKPLLQKVVINQQVLYEAGTKAGRVEVDSGAPARIECTFVNKGSKPGEDPFMVFLHVGIGDAVTSSDFSPAMPTTRWDTDQLIVEAKSIDLSAFDGKDVELLIGLYRGADRFSLINEGMDYQQRLPAGVLSVRRLGQAANPATVATENPETERNGPFSWKERLGQVKARIAKGNANLVFIGDAIIQDFGGDPKPKTARADDVWRRHYGHRGAVNLGFGKDQTQHVLWRMENGGVDGMAPKVVVVMIGGENARRDQTARQVTEGVRAVVNQLRERLPSTKILLLGILPCGAFPFEKIKDINANLSEFHDGERVHVLDAGRRFQKTDGSIDKDLMSDGHYPNSRGYRVLAEFIEPKIAELLGDKPVR